MRLERLSPGMEDGEETDLGAEILRVLEHDLAKMGHREPSFLCTQS